MKIQLLRRRLCRAKYLLPLFKYFEQSESKVKDGRISSLVSLLFIFSFILNTLSSYQYQVHLWQPQKQHGAGNCYTSIRLHILE